jgi:hypothetical protein
MLHNKRIRALSRILSVANGLCGLWLLVLARDFALDLAALKPHLLIPTRLFLWVGPWGWLAFMFSTSALMLVNLAKFRQDWINRGVTPALWFALSGEVVGIVCFAVMTFLQPICTLSSTIRPS